MKAKVNISALRRKYHALLKQACVDQAGKEAILDGCGVSTSVDLTVEQLQGICESLQEQVNQRTGAPLDIRRLRSKVLDLLTNIGVYRAGPDPWPAVNAYLTNPKIAGKLLFHLDNIELKALIKKLTIIEKWTKTEQINKDEIARSN